MTVGIVTDSTCDLPAGLCEELGIEVVPLYVNIDGQSHLDGVDLTRETFYDGLAGYEATPTTATPGPSAFKRAYQRLADAGVSGVVSIHIAEALSETVNVARLAAKSFGSVPVTVIDSGQLTLGVGLSAVHAARRALAGADLSEVVDSVRSRIARTWTFAGLATVEFLRKSGRLSRFQYELAALLRILPLLKMHGGQADMERVRTHRRAMRRVVELASELGPLEELAIVHTNAREQADQMLNWVSHLVPTGASPVFGQVTPVIGAHIGPGAAGVVCVAKS